MSDREKAREILGNCESIGNWGEEAEEKIETALRTAREEGRREGIEGSARICEGLGGGGNN